MSAAPLGRRRPRPVADVPALEGRDLARAWLVALVSAAPFERAAALPGPGFTVQAPRLCAAIVAALASDAALDDLEPGGGAAPLAAGAGVMAGADGAAEAVAALEVLRGVVWLALLDELPRPPAGQLADLADRLGATLATVTAAALDAGTSLPSRPGDRGPLAAILRGGPEGEAPSPPAREVERPSGALRPDRSSASTGPSGGTPPGASDATPPGPSGPTPPGPSGPTPPGPSGPTPPGRSSGEPEPFARPAAVEDGEGFHARVAPWTAAVERRIQRHADDGLPFALLCVEVADLDRLVAADRDRDVAEALEAAEVALAAQLRPADVLVRERPGRYWLVAPDTDAEAARSLAHLLAAAVAGVPGHRGAPLEVSVGIAAAPQDGVDAPALEGRAEEGLFAARAAGVRVAGPLRG